MSRERMPGTITIRPSDRGRWAIGPSRFPGNAIIVQITGRRRGDCPTGRCVWGGAFAGREVRLDREWRQASWLGEGDAGWLNDEETVCGVIRGNDFVVLQGEEARVAMVAASAS